MIDKMYASCFAFSLILVVSSELVYCVYGQERFDRYETFTNSRNERAHLDNFAIFLLNHPETIGYIGYYSGTRKTFRSTANRVLAAKRYLIINRKIEINRIRIIYLGKLGQVATTVLQPLDKNLPPPFKPE